MAKFKAGDIIVSAKGAVRKVVDVLVGLKLYQLVVVKSKTQPTGTLYSFDIDRIDAAFSLQITHPNKFNVGEEIQSIIQPLFRGKIISLDLANLMYMLEVTHTTLGWSAVTSRIIQSIPIVEMEFQSYQPITPKTSNSLYGIEAFKSLYDMEYQVSFETKPKCECGLKAPDSMKQSVRHYGWCQMYKGA